MTNVLKIKPHIKLEAGVWRCSPVPREHNYDNRIIRAFRLAYEFVNDHNRINVVLPVGTQVLIYRKSPGVVVKPERADAPNTLDKVWVFDKHRGFSSYYSMQKISLNK